MLVNILIQFLKPGKSQLIGLAAIGRRGEIIGHTFHIVQKAGDYIVFSEHRRPVKVLIFKYALKLSTLFIRQVNCQFSVQL